MTMRTLRKRKPLLMKGNEQYCLDFGQKNLDPIVCRDCGMVYCVGEESDEKQHVKYHTKCDEGIRWPAKLERPRKYYDDGSRVVSLTTAEPKPVLEAVNRMLKTAEGPEDVSKLLTKEDLKLFLYINNRNHLVGYICVEPIKEAYNLVDFDASRLESDPTPAECGILYLWVHPKHRRRGIGSKLIDVARGNLNKSKMIHKHRVAVCEPTETAIPFLNSYVRSKRPVKVYQQ